MGTAAHSRITKGSVESNRNCRAFKIDQIARTRAGIQPVKPARTRGRKSAIYI
jgi:hypothetical protein